MLFTFRLMWLCLVAFSNHLVVDVSNLLATLMFSSGQRGKQL